ncbi:hypothetical protein AHMF7605_10220 [Adhaeribacter arboris]|uniref:DUF4149 domain-containing protein n=1 Tax=Adhaeribacter arboris TaxID=2072846 RepID=A0A2T2YEC5_9BACT|nr:hypothetical protein AHMF7605_10220 [Adhaeribacter arboris]
MTRIYYLPFLAFLAFLLLILLFSFNFATSVDPGWHTTIFPSYFIWTLVLLLVLSFSIIGYWLVLKQINKFNWTLFIIHLLLTVSTVIFVKFPSIFLDVPGTEQEELIKNIFFRIQLISWCYGLFMAGQILFLVYFIRVIRTRPLKT